MQAEIRKKKKINWQRVAFIVSFTIIPVASFLLFYVYVNIDSLVMAFRTPDGTGTGLRFAGFENFKWVFQRLFHGSESAEMAATEDLRLAFKNTALTWLLNQVMFIGGIMVAYFIYKKIPGHKAFRIIFNLPGLISGVVVSFFYIELMSPSSGFPAFLEKLFHLDYTLRSPLKDSTFANPMVFLNIIWLSFPGSLIIWGGTFSRIPDSLIEQGKLDGVNWIQELFLIILPLVWPTLVLFISSNIAGFFGASGSVFLLTQGDYGTNTISNWMYMRTLESVSPYSSVGIYYVAAMGLVFSLVATAVALTLRFFLNRRVEETQY